MVDRESVAKRKLEACARGIIANQISMPIGILRMTRLISTDKTHLSKLEIDLSIFKVAYAEISDYQLGSERLNCSLDFLLQQDKKLIKTLSKYHEPILQKCFEITSILSLGDITTH